MSEIARDPFLDRLDQAAIPWERWNWTAWGVFFLIAALMPWLTNAYILRLIISFFIWGMVVQCWNLIMGVSGIFSFGQIALFGLGAWTSALMAIHLGMSPWLTTLAGGLVAMVASLAIGLPVLRLRGLYVVLLTLAFHELLRNFFIQGPYWVTFGGGGPKQIERYSLPVIGEFQLNEYYFMGLILFMLCTYMIWRVYYSPIGMAFQGLRDSETYAISRGINPYRFKLFLFAFSAFFTGVAGSFNAHYLTGIDSSILSFSSMNNGLAMIVLGGWGSFVGPIFGAGLLTLLIEVLREFNEYRLIALGLSIALIVIFYPKGLWPIMERSLKDAVASIRSRVADLRSRQS